MCWMIKTCLHTFKLNSVIVMVNWLGRNVVVVVIVVIACSSRYRESMRSFSFCDSIISCLENHPSCVSTWNLISQGMSADHV